jgi:hypothetical protein
LRQEPSAVQTAIRIANDLSADEIAGSPVARNTLILLRQATERDGLALTATGNLSSAAGCSGLVFMKTANLSGSSAIRSHSTLSWSRHG